MSTESASVALERIDHGVLGSAFRFWTCTSPEARDFNHPR
jgi:hypothetical protein